MTVRKDPMQSTLRDWQYWRRPLILWVMISLVASVAGPFGTLGAMGLGGRLMYWAGVVAGAILLSLWAFCVARGRPVWQVMLVWALFCLSMATLVHLLNGAVFADWKGGALWGYLLGIVALITATVHGLNALIGGRSEGTVDAPDLRFQRRLPLAVRGALQRVEAQDHYLNVVTDRGSALILMRLSDALEELAAEPGLQVHRSHWVATRAVVAHQRTKGRDILVMSCGANVPVSRSFRPAAQTAGLF